MGTFLKPPATRSGPSVATSPAGAPVVLHLGAAHTGMGAVRKWCGSQAARLADHGIRTRAESSRGSGDNSRTDRHPDLATWLRDIRASTHGTEPVRVTERARGTIPAQGAPSGGSFYSGTGATGPVLDPAAPGIYPHLVRTLGGVAASGTGLDIHVQFAVADHAAFLEAVYVRQVARGLALTFDEYLDATGREPSWLPIVQALVDTFGAEHVTVYDGEAGRPLADRVLDDAMARLGVRDVATRTPRRRTAHRSSGRTADLSLSMGPHLRTDTERTAFRHFLRSGLFVADRPASFFAPDRAAELSARYAEDLRRIRRIVQVR